jgi:hypothetical protein
MRKPQKESMHRIREILDLYDEPLVKTARIIESLAIDREEVMETGMRLGAMGEFERGKIAGIAEGREAATKEIKQKYRLVPLDPKERLAYIREKLKMPKL